MEKKAEPQKGIHLIVVYVAHGCKLQIQLHKKNINCSPNHKFHPKPFWDCPLLIGFFEENNMVTDSNHRFEGEFHYLSLFENKQNYKGTHGIMQ